MRRARKPHLTIIHFPPNVGTKLRTVPDMSTRSEDERAAMAALVWIMDHKPNAVGILRRLMVGLREHAEAQS
jgi:hypothetical protein